MKLIKITNEQGKYKGMTENGVPEGIGKMKYTDGTMYIGFWHEGKRNGNGILFREKEVLFSGMWESDSETGENLKDNIKTETLENGNVIRGQYSDGKFNGMCLITNAEKDYQYFGEVSENAAEGKGVLYNGMYVYAGGFSGGLPHGEGVQMLPHKELPEFDNGYYDTDDRYEGSWEKGNKQGPFIRMRGGLPYDEYFQGGPNCASSWLDYSTEDREYDIEEGCLRCIYGGHSAFYIETPSSTLLFDWYRSKVPPIRPDKPLYIFISHIHMDHFNEGVMRLADYFPNTEIYIGYDRGIEAINRSLDSLSEKVKDSISHFVGAQRLCTDFGEVRSLSSNELGTAFIVEADGMTLFHAGDLAWSDQENDADFRKFTEPLRDKTIHYAMLPLDPRFSDHGDKTLDYYHKLSNIILFTPMHLWENYDYIKKFADDYPQYSPKMVAVNTKNAEIAAGIRINDPYMLKFE